MAINLDAGFLMAKAFVPGMKARHGGHIVGISSNTVAVHNINFLHHVTSKMGVIGLTRALASDVGNAGIGQQFRPPFYPQPSYEPFRHRAAL